MSNIFLGLSVNIKTFYKLFMNKCICDNHLLIIFTCIDESNDICDLWEKEIKMQLKKKWRNCEINKEERKEGRGWKNNAIKTKVRSK